MTKTQETALNQAITLSEDYNEIVRITVDDPAECVDYLRQEAEDEGYEFDHISANDNVTECWAYEEDAPEGEMVWRVHLVDAAVEDMEG